jgi:hypothetical protein
MILAALEKSFSFLHMSQSELYKCEELAVVYALAFQTGCRNSEDWIGTPSCNVCASPWKDGFRQTVHGVSA